MEACDKKLLLLAPFSPTGLIHRSPSFLETAVCSVPLPFLFHLACVVESEVHAQWISLYLSFSDPHCYLSTSGSFQPLFLPIVSFSPSTPAPHVLFAEWCPTFLRGCVHFSHCFFFLLFGLHNWYSSVFEFTDSFFCQLRSAVGPVW